MHRQQILSLLESYQPTSEELPHKEQMIAFIKQYNDCFERTLTVGHITGSAWLLDQTGNKALLMHHSKIDKWLQLGGHADGEVDILAVALKEAREESGIDDIKAVTNEIFDIDIHEIPARTNEPAHFHYDIRFLLQVTSNKEAKKNNESKALHWIESDPKQLLNQERSVARMFEKWQRYRE